MNEKFNTEVIATSQTVRIDNSGDADRAFNIKAVATYKDGQLANVNDGKCEPVDAAEEDRYAESSNFAKYGQLSVNFGESADITATSKAISDFIDQIGTF